MHFTNCKNSWNNLYFILGSPRSGKSSILRLLASSAFSAIQDEPIEVLSHGRVQRKFGSLLRENQIEDLDVFSANADFNVALDQSKKLAYGFEFTHNELQSIGFSQNLVVEGNDIVDLVIAIASM